MSSVAEVRAVARHEFVTYVRRRTFLLVTFGLPVAGMIFSVILGGAGLTMGRGLATALELPAGGMVAAAIRVGYVDPAGFITREPEGGAVYVPLPDERAARNAVTNGEVATAYLIPPDYPENREVVRLSTGLQRKGADQAPLESLLRANLWPAATESDLEDLANPGQRVDLALDLARYRVAKGNVAAIGLPILLGVLLYATIFTVSSYLLQGVTTEKETRVLEILLTSARPSSLLAGKLLGLGALGALQMGVWLILGSVVAVPGIAVTAQLAGLETGPDVLVLAGVYFVLGYFFYASVMAAVGAVSPSFKESGALTFVVLLPAWIPFFALEAILSDPNGRAATMFSLFPPTAPLVGVMRVVSAPVPPMELALSYLFLLAGGVVIMWIASRLFSSTLLLAAGLPGARAVVGAMKRSAA